MYVHHQTIPKRENSLGPFGLILKNFTIKKYDAIDEIDFPVIEGFRFKL